MKASGSFILILLLVAICGGCAASGPTGDDPVQSWTAAHGGCLETSTPQVSRARSIARGLGAAVVPGRVNVNVLRSAAVGAYAWPDGRVFVTTGMLNRFDDATLRAAIAHEIGHLLTGGHLAHTALAGHEGHTSTETEADRAGCELLRAAGHDPRDMIRMLHQVASAPGTRAETRQALLHRAALLSSALP